MAETKTITQSSPWWVYMLRCYDDSLYTGITTDLTRRLHEHNQCNQLGARYTRSRRPVQLVYRQALASRSLAMQKEYAIKKLSKRAKEQLIIALESSN